MDIIDAGQRPDPRRRWEEATRPDELLGILRDRRKTEPLPAAILRRFAARCARQRGSDAYVDDVVSALASTGAFNTSVSDPPGLARIRAIHVAIANSAARYLDTPARTSAARRLAAFNTLLDDPLDAALGASAHMLRNGARNEADLGELRVGQLRWLREIFEAPPAREPTPAARIDAPFTCDRRATPETVRFLRALRGRARVLVARDPWIPVPQQGCNFAFGPNALPLPIGALMHLWEHWRAMHGGCSLCGGEVWGYSIGGMITVGGVRGCCLVCEHDAVRRIGGMVAVADLVRPILDRTAYQIAEIGTAGSFAGTDARFWEEREELELEWAMSG
jgi:hypothetical protein